MSLTPCKIRSCADWHANARAKIKAVFVAAIAIVAAMACSPACAQEREDIFAVEHAALEALATRCGLILKCKITEASDPQKVYLQCPGLEATAPTEIYYKYTADTEAPLKDTKDLWPKVTATFPAGGLPIVVYTPAKPRKSKDDLTPEAFYLPKLENGKTYLLMLVKLPATDKNVYYLPNHPSCVQPFDEEHTAAIKKAIDEKTWPWSKSVDGLQIALFVHCEVVGPKPASMPSDGKFDVLVHVSLAARNASDKPVYIDRRKSTRAQPWWCGFGLTAAKDGVVVHAKLYPSDEADSPASRPAASADYVLPAHSAAIPTVSNLALGQVAFIMPCEGEGDVFSVPMKLTPGQWTITATYKRDQEAGKGPDEAHPLWTGAVETSAKLNVQHAGQQASPAPAAAPELELPDAWKTPMATSQPAAVQKGPAWGEDIVAWAVYPHAKIAVGVGSDCRVELHRFAEGAWKPDAKHVAEKKSRLADVRFTTVPGLVYLLAIDTDMETKLKGSDQQRYPDYSLRLDLTGQAKGWHAIPYENANEQVLDACYRATDKGLDLHMGNAAAIQVELPETVAEPFRSGPGDPFAQAVFVFPGEGILTKTATGWAVNSMDGKLKKHFSTEKIEAMWWGKPTVKEHEFFVHARTGPGGETYRLNTSSGEMVRVKE